MKVESDLRIIVASNEAPLRVGGLAAYACALAEQLSENVSMSGVFLSLGGHRNLASPSASNSLIWPVRTLMDSAAWIRLWWPLLSRLAPRPLLHPLLERIVSVAVTPRRIIHAAGRADVIHFVGTGWDFLGFAFLRAARMMGARFTVWPAVHPHSWGDDRIDVRFYRQADGVFCQSDYEKIHLAALGIPQKTLVRCRPPATCRMDGDSERFRSQHGLEGKSVVLFLGRRDEGKGYPALLKAWQVVLKKCPNAVLLLAGPGGEHHSSLLMALPLGSVCDLGVPGEETKADALAACNVFCLPSAHESFGIVYLEAWAYGKPVICGTAPACRELVEDGITGLWSDGTSESITASIVWLLQNPAVAEKLGSHGRILSETEYTAEKMLHCHLEAWQPGYSPSSLAKV